MEAPLEAPLDLVRRCSEIDDEALEEARQELKELNDELAQQQEVCTPPRSAPAAAALFPPTCLTASGCRGAGDVVGAPLGAKGAQREGEPQPTSHFHEEALELVAGLA